MFESMCYPFIEISFYEYNLTDADDEKFEHSFGHNQSFSMSDVLWACSNIFANW